MTAKAITDQDDRAAIFGKLLPSEVTALYLSLRPLFVDMDVIYQLIVAAVCLLLSVLFIRTVRGVASWGHTAIYTITFCIWVLTLEANSSSQFFQYIGAGSQGAAALVVALSIIWTFFVTYIVPVKFVAST